MAEPVYSVLLGEPVFSDIPRLAETIAKITKQPFHDVAGAVRRGWGILLENATEADARAVADGLTEAGVKARLISSAEWRKKPPVAHVSAFDFRPDGFQFTVEKGKSGKVEFERFRLFCAAGYLERHSTTRTVTEGPTPGQKALKMGLMMAGLPLPIGGKKKEVAKTDVSNEPLYFLDLITGEPPVCFRIDAQKLNYAFLGEKMAPNSNGNFKILLFESARRLPGAVQNKGARLLLKNQPLTSLGYESLADLEREETWLWNVA